MPLHPPLPHGPGRVRTGGAGAHPRGARRDRRRGAPLRRTVLGLPPSRRDRTGPSRLLPHLPRPGSQDPRDHEPAACRAPRGSARHRPRQGVPPHEGSRLQETRGHRPRRRRRLLRRPPGRDPGPGRRVRLRQDHHPLGGPLPPGAPGGQDRGPGQGHGRPGAGPAPPGAPRPADRLPGPHGLPGPAPADLRHHRRTAAGQRLEENGHRTAHRGAHGARRARAQSRQPLPAQLLRRAASAHRHRPCSGARTQSPGPR